MTDIVRLNKGLLVHLPCIWSLLFWVAILLNLPCPLALHLELVVLGGNLVKSPLSTCLASGACCFGWQSC